MHGIWLLFAGLVLLFSGQAMEAAEQAVQVFGKSVLPALFPMMVLGGMVGNSSLQQRGRGVFLVIFSFFSGSPASARQAMLMDQCSAFSHQKLMMLLCMSGVMSPMFFIGSLGARLGSRTGWLLLLCHWAAALLTGIVCLLWYKVKEAHLSHTAAQPEDTIVPKRESDAAQTASLPAAISSAALALLSVLGAMMVFAIAAALTRALLAALFPVWVQRHGSALTFLWALLEVGGGSLALLASGAPPWVLCGLCSFGGLSIWMQNLLFLNHRIRPVELLGWRMLHGALGALFSYLILRIFPAALTAAAHLPSGGQMPQLVLLLLTALALPRLWAS